MPNPQEIDISHWTAADRSVTVRWDRENLFFGLIIDTKLVVGVEGQIQANVVVFANMFMYPHKIRWCKEGDANQQFRFVAEPEEIQKARDAHYELLEAERAAKIEARKAQIAKEVLDDASSSSRKAERVSDSSTSRDAFDDNLVASGSSGNKRQNAARPARLRGQSKGKN